MLTSSRFPVDDQAREVMRTELVYRGLDPTVGNRQPLISDTHELYGSLEYGGEVVGLVRKHEDSKILQVGGGLCLWTR
jgi:hypothetical protein